MGEGALMKRIRRLLVCIIAPAAIVGSLLLLAAPSAQAYGTDHVYQLTFSLNCNDRNSPLCAPDAFGLGGVWGWIEPDSDGTVDATVTFCGHQQGFNGAAHENLDGVSWSIVTGEQLTGQFAVGVDPTDRYIVFDPSSDLGFIAFPVTPNHYSMSFGPGVTAQSTVVLMH